MAVAPTGSSMIIAGDVVSIFLSSLKEDPAMVDFGAKVEYTALEGLPPTESGACISKRSLSAADQAQLRSLLESARQGPLARWFQKYYSPDFFKFFILNH